MINTPRESWYGMKRRGSSSTPAVGVLIAVGAGVALLMAMWPLMVAFSEAAAVGLGMVAVLALGALALADRLADQGRTRR